MNQQNHLIFLIFLQKRGGAQPPLSSLVKSWFLGFSRAPDVLWFEWSSIRVYETEIRPRWWGEDRFLTIEVFDVRVGHDLRFVPCDLWSGAGRETLRRHGYLLGLLCVFFRVLDLVHDEVHPVEDEVKHHCDEEKKTQNSRHQVVPIERANDGHHHSKNQQTSEGKSSHGHFSFRENNGCILLTKNRLCQCGYPLLYSHANRHTSRTRVRE